MRDSKVRLLIVLTKSIFFLLRLLPTRQLVLVAARIGRLVSYFCPLENSISIAQLRRAFPKGVPEYDGERAPLLQPLDFTQQPSSFNPDYLRFSRDVFSHVGQTVGELLVCERFIAGAAGETPSVTSPQDDILETVKLSGQAAVGFSAHLGCYELCAAYLASKGLRCAVIGRTPNYHFLARLLDEYRRSYGVEVIWRDSPDSARQIIKAIKQGMVICVLLDQDTNLKNGFAPFFGLDAASPLGPVELALRYKVPMFTSFIVRTAPLQHHLETTQIHYNPDDQDAARKILGVYNDRLSKMISLYPEQWIWWHRRWRRRPGIDYLKSPELLRSTRDYAAWLETLSA